MRRKKGESRGVPYFAERVSFDELFPTIEDVSAEVSELFDGPRDEWPKAGHYDKLSLKISGETIRCSNSKCNGGFPIGHVLSKMVAENQEEHEVIQLCNGRELEGKTRRLGCPHMFKVKVSIKYKPQ